MALGSGRDRYLAFAGRLLAAGDEVVSMSVSAGDGGREEKSDRSSDREDSLLNLVLFFDGDSDTSLESTSSSDTWDMEDVFNSQ